MHKVWDYESEVDCILEHHQGYLYMFTDAPRDGKPSDGHYLLRCPVVACDSGDWEVCMCMFCHFELFASIICNIYFTESYMTNII
jgi:hypothetical protein